MGTKKNMEFYKSSPRFQAALKTWLAVYADLKAGKSKAQIEKELGKKPRWVNWVLWRLREEGYR